MRPPCRHSPDRTAVPNCHASCERYLAYRAERDRLLYESRLRAEADEVIIHDVISCARPRRAQRNYNPDNNH